MIPLFNALAPLPIQRIDPSVCYFLCQLERTLAQSSVLLERTLARVSVMSPHFRNLHLASIISEFTLLCFFVGLKKNIFLKSQIYFLNTHIYLLFFFGGETPSRFDILKYKMMLFCNFKIMGGVRPSVAVFVFSVL